MPSGIPYDRARRSIIKEHMKKQEDDAGGKEHLPQGKLIVKGRVEIAPIYRFDLDDLAFNKVNGRIKAEVLEKEAELGRLLDAWSLEDQKVMKEILLSIRTEENLKIKNDLEKNGQINPGIITCDGIVINGNRRKALLKELSTRDEKYNYLEVHVLPSDITKAELWLIEAGIQLTTPQQLDYSPINHLLKLREGVDAGLDIESMSNRIYGVSSEKIEEDLERLDLIDEYLRDFLGKEGKYYLVKHLNEHFIDLWDILSRVEQQKGRTRRADWAPDENDINELKLVGFYYIRIKYPHLRIRGLRDIFIIEKAWHEAKQAVNINNILTAEEKAKLGISFDGKEIEETEEDSEVSTGDDTFTTSTEEQDLQEEALWRRTHERNLKSFYEDAKEQEQITKDTEKPLALAKRALKNIKAIPSTAKKILEPEIDDVLHDIILNTNKLRKVIHKYKKRHRKQ